MRRRHVHAMYAAALLACSLLAVGNGVRYGRASSTQDIVARISAGDERLPASVAEEVVHARAQADANAGRYDDALAAYKALARSDRDDVRFAALYNLGNLHLREAMRIDPDDNVRALAFTELAKQAYRDLLRMHPDDWDARYNLERALWLAPEIDEAVDEPIPPLQSERAPTTMKSDQGALP